MTGKAAKRKPRVTGATLSQAEKRQTRATSKQSLQAALSPMGASQTKALVQDLPAPKAPLQVSVPEQPEDEKPSGAKTPQGFASAAREVQKELKKLRKLQSDGNGSSSLPAGSFEVELKDEQDLYTWRIKLRPSLFAGSPLEQDLQKAARAQKVSEVPVLLEVTFPPTFPRAPPFIRVVSPRFAFHTGHVTIGGSICTQFLTASGWTPGYPLENVLVQIIVEMMEGNGRLDTHHRSREYSEHEARAAFTRVARDHGWKI